MNTSKGERCHRPFPIYHPNLPTRSIKRSNETEFPTEIIKKKSSSCCDCNKTPATFRGIFFYAAHIVDAMDLTGSQQFQTKKPMPPPRVRV